MFVILRGSNNDKYYAGYGHNSLAPSSCSTHLNSQFSCKDIHYYNTPYVSKGEIIYNDKWNTLKENIDAEYERRCRVFESSKSKSNYYRHKYFEELKRNVGDLVTASSFNSLAQIVNDLGLECACNCAYCTCNCNVCTCNSVKCPCNCHHGWPMSP